MAEAEESRLQKEVSDLNQSSSSHHHHHHDKSTKHRHDHDHDHSKTADKETKGDKEVREVKEAKKNAENIKEAKEDSPAKAEEAKDQKERPWLLVSALNGPPAVIAQPNPQPGFRPAPGFVPGFVRVSCRFHTRPSGSTPDLRVLHGLGVRGFSVSSTLGFRTRFRNQAATRP